MKIAQIGYGYWGPNVSRNISRNPNFQFVCLCEKIDERLKRARQLYGDKIQYSVDSEEVIQNPNIEGVALVIETSAHFELAQKALLAGKDVYIEKPLTFTVKEAKELKELAIRLDRILHVDHIMIYHPAIRKIKEIIASGELGNIIFFDCSRLNLGQLKNDVSAMWDLSVHDLSVIDFLTDGAEMEEVSYMGSTNYTRFDSVSSLLVRYRQGFTANIRASWISPIKERKMLIAGTKKMIVYDDVDVLNKLIVYDKGFDLDPNQNYQEFVVKTRQGDAFIPKLEIQDALYNSLEHFRGCCQSRTQSLSSADAAIRVQTILEKADPHYEEP